MANPKKITFTRRKAVGERSGHDQNAFHVHTNFELTSGRFFRPLRKDTALWHFLKPQEKELLESLFAISGVTQVVFTSYEVYIRKGVLFSMVEIEAKTTDAFQKVYGVALVWGIESLKKGGSAQAE